jgi:hypothetical protein
VRIPRSRMEIKTFEKFKSMLLPAATWITAGPCASKLCSITCHDLYRGSCACACWWNCHVSTVHAQPRPGQQHLTCQSGWLAQGSQPPATVTAAAITAAISGTRVNATSDVTVHVVRLPNITRSCRRFTRCIGSGLNIEY